MPFNDKISRVFSFKISPKVKGEDILIAELSELGFYAFEQRKKDIKAYIYDRMTIKSNEFTYSDSFWHGCERYYYIFIKK
mgnify:CR=1 FL=1